MVFLLVLNYILSLANFKKIANFLIIVCVITVNRYGDNNAYSCENYRSKI